MEEVSSSELSFYEELFQHRYTDNDAGYLKTLKAPVEPPPCVENWYSRPKRAFDWARNAAGQPQDNRSFQDHRGRGGFDNRGRPYQRGYNDYESNRGFSRGQYNSREYDQRNNSERVNPSGEPRNKYFRGHQGRGYN